MSVVHSPRPAPEIPDTDLTAFVLRHAGRLAERPAVIDGPSGRAPRSWWASSRTVYSGLAAVTTAPARSPAWRAIGNSGRFGRWRASTSPGRKPRAASPPATRSTLSASAP